MTRDSRLATLLAFAIIYFVWGSTFLAIRFGVSEVPPLLFAAMRFLAAGLALYLWSTAPREPQPSRQQWTSVSLLALLILRLALALGVGLAGVAVLMSRSLNLGGAPIDRLGAVALIFAAASWSVAS